MGCCFSEEQDQTAGPNEHSRLLSPTHSTPIPTTMGNSGSHISKTDEESALNRILQRTAHDVIDVTYVEPHSLEQSELKGRTREYQSQMASLRRVNKSNTLPNSDQPPQTTLSKELPSTADIRFISDHAEAADAAVQSMEIKHAEPLVVQFAAP